MYAVPDQTLDVVAAIWGVSEASRAPNSLGNLFVTLFLLKREVISWREAAGGHDYRYLPSGGEVGYDLQRLFGAIVAKNEAKTEIPADLMRFAKPYRESLARFIATASLNNNNTYTLRGRKVTVKKIKIVGSYLKIEAEEEEDAQEMLAATMHFKVLRHLE